VSDEPERFMVCGFCSRHIFPKDDTINMGCGYCDRKTRAQIAYERERDELINHPPGAWLYETATVPSPSGGTE
jgi:hypothetical protein